jgi:hypothetical protein
MKSSRTSYVKTKARTIRTNLMEILQALTSQTKDDALIVESLANIFASYRGRFGHSLAPVRIAAGKPKRSSQRAYLNSRDTVWA